MNANEPWHPYRIQKLRELLLLTLDEMGKEIGVSGQTIFRWERGRSRPRKIHCRTLAKLEVKVLAPKT